MYILVTYDVDTTDTSGPKRLRKVAKACLDHGQRVQNSVFECLVDAAQCTLLKHELCTLMDEEKDSLRFYYLGNHYQTKVEHFGAKQTYEPEGILMI